MGAASPWLSLKLDSRPPRGRPRAGRPIGGSDAGARVPGPLHDPYLPGSVSYGLELSVCEPLAWVQARAQAWPSTPPYRLAPPCAAARRSAPLQPYRAVMTRRTLHGPQRVCPAPFWQRMTVTAAQSLQESSPGPGRCGGSLTQERRQAGGGKLNDRNPAALNDLGQLLVVSSGLPPTLCAEGTGPSQ